MNAGGRVGVILSVALGAGALAGHVPAVSAQFPSPQVAVVSPTYSTDGSQVAYAIHHDGDPRGYLVIGSANGGGLRSVYSSTDSCCSSITWASSQRVLFVDDYQLKSVNLQSKRVTNLATGAAYFYLSPNRETAAIAEGCECNHAPDSVALIDPDDRGYRLVPKPKNRTDELDGFSPDGTQLVFTRYPYTYDNPATNKPSLYAVSVRGGEPVPIAKSGLIGTSHLPRDADNVAWSRDGHWLSFATPAGLWLMNTATGTARLVASRHGPAAPAPGSTAWSPASSELAYAGLYRSGKQTKAGPVWATRLTLVSTRGVRTPLWHGSLTYLTGNPGDRPQWAPNGRSLIFLARSLGSRAWAQAWTISTDRRRLHQIS